MNAGEQKYCENHVVVLICLVYSSPIQLDLLGSEAGE